MDTNKLFQFDQSRASVKQADGSTALKATKRGQLYIVNQMNNRAMNASDENDNLLRWHL